MSNISPEGGLVPAFVQCKCPTSALGIEMVVVEALFQGDEYEEYLLECERGLQEGEEFLVQPHADEEGRRVAIDIVTDTKRWYPTLVAAERNQHIPAVNLPERLAALVCPPAELLAS